MIYVHNAHSTHKISYRYNVFRSKLVNAEEAKNHEDYVKKVGQYRCPHKTEKIKHLSLDYCYLHRDREQTKQKRIGSVRLY